jgi:hypothetical protein
MRLQWERNNCVVEFTAKSPLDLLDQALVVKGLLLGDDDGEQPVVRLEIVAIDETNPSKFTWRWTGANLDATMSNEDIDRWVGHLWPKLEKLSQQSPAQSITWNTPGFRCVQNEIKDWMHREQFPANEGVPSA